MDVVGWMDRNLYPLHGDRWDDTLLREAILSVLRPGDRVLDVGAGAGIIPMLDFRGHAGRICGIDPDPRVQDNPMLDEAKIAFVEDIPYPDQEFDLVFADNVLEHLPNPAQSFQEIVRVLKPGGYFIFKTPNLYHYVATLASMTPHWFHVYYNQLRGCAPGDVFPTLYRANTRQAVREIATAAGLDVEEIRLIEGRPEYLRLTPPTYLVGAIYERVVNHFDALAALRVILVGRLRRPTTRAA